MNTVSNIIFEMLASGRGLNLPEVGSLYVERDSAKFISGKEMKPPYNKVVFSRRQNDNLESVITLMAAGGMGVAAAEKEYNLWLESARRDKGMIEVNEVGVLKNDFFYPSAALHDILNPESGDNIKLKSASGGRRILWTVIIVVLLAAAVVFFVLALNRYLGRDEAAPVARQGTEQTAAQMPGDRAESDMPADVIQRELEDYAATTGRQDATAGEGETVSAPVAATPGENGAVGKLSLWQRFMNLFRCGENKRVAGPLTVSEAVSPAVPAVAAPVVPDTPEPVNEPENRVVPAAGKPVYHIVAGVFSDPKNADRLIAGDHLQLGRDGYKKMPYKDGLTMIVVYTSTDWDAAVRRWRQLLRNDCEIWIYTQE